MLKSSLKSITDNYLQQLSTTKGWLILAAKVTTASIVALLLAKYLASPQSFFLILATILLMLNNPDDTLYQRLGSMIFAGILGSAGVYLATLASTHLLALLVVSIITITIGINAARINLSYALAGLCALLLVITAGGIPANSAIALERLILCLYAWVIALVVTFLLFPTNPRKKLKETLILLLHEATEYFYYSYTDNLRGNHINPRHWQIKEHILTLLSKSRCLAQSLKQKTAAEKKLQTLLTAVEKLVDHLLPLTNILTDPASNTAFANVLPELSQFGASTRALLQSYGDFLKNDIDMPDSKDFLQSCALLQNKIDTALNVTLQKEIVYHWPFDMTIFSYYLKDLQITVAEFGVIANDVSRIK